MSAVWLIWWQNYFANNQNKTKQNNTKNNNLSLSFMRWVGLWGFLWWAPSAKRKDHHGVSSGWSSVLHRSNTGLSSTQYEQIPIITRGLAILADSLLFSVNNILAGLWLNCISFLKLLSFFWLTYHCSIWLCCSVRVKLSLLDPHVHWSKVFFSNDLSK